VAQKRKSAFQISYVTITYRSVLMGLLAVVGLALIVMYFAFPDFSNKLIMSGEASVGKVLAKVGILNGGTGSNSADPGPQQAHFTNIDGVVRVKKASSSTWVSANYTLALERNDIVQTSDEGIAKVVFADGTSYTVKPDSLIVIQENSINAAQETKVAVQVTTGTVDLATASLARGSKSQVQVGEAVASINADSAAQVMKDPRGDQAEILVKKGSADVQRRDQTVKLAEYEKVDFGNQSAQMIKSKEIRPPFLIAPRDVDTVPVDMKSKEVTLSWGPVEGVRSYHVKVSKNKFFTGSPVLDQKDWPTLEMRVKGLDPGVYFWEVYSSGDDGKESVASVRNSFTVVPKGENNSGILLELDPLVQHGHVIEVRGRTEQGARVMVNGQEVAMVSSEGKFSHFTNPLPTGENLITITAQNAKGGVNTKQQTITIQ